MKTTIKGFSIIVNTTMVEDQPRVELEMQIEEISTEATPEETAAYLQTMTSVFSSALSALN